MADIITTFPTLLDFGYQAPSADRIASFSFTSSVAAAGADELLVTISLDDADGNVGLLKNGKSSPNLILTNIAANTQTAVSLYVGANGSVKVSGEVGFYFRVNGSITQYETKPFTLRRARVFSFPIDWADGVEETYSFKTDIVAGRSGVEYRSAVRHNPKVVKEFTVVTFDCDTTSKLLGCVSGAMQFPFIVPDHARIAMQINSYAAGANIPLFPNRHTPTTNQVPEYYFDNAMNLYDPLSPKAVNGVTAGDQMFTGEICHMDDNPSMEYLSPECARMSVSFVSERLSALLDAEGDIDLNIVDISTSEPMLQMFALPPSRGSYGIDFDYTRSFVDNERGMVDRFRNQKFTQKVYSQEFENIRCDEANHIIRFFCAHRGRFKPFVISSWNCDANFAVAPTLGDTTVTLIGDAMYHNYRNDPAYKAFAIHMKDGAIYTAAIADNGWALDNGNTVITLQIPVRRTLTLTDVNHVSLSPFVRFASDDLNVSWHSDRVASISLKFTTTAIPTNTTL